MHTDPLHHASHRRQLAAIIIRHCKRNGSAWLRDERGWEEAGAYLAARGFGTVKPSASAGRGTTFTLN